MHLSWGRAATAAVFTVCLGAAAEKKIERSALPAAVQKTADAQAQGATVKGYSVDRENGETLYEAEMIVDGHSRDIEIAKDGTLREVEEEVSLQALPVTVQQALSNRANGAKITKVESLTKKDRLVAYEASTLKGTRKGEVQVGPNGEKLTHEE